MPQGNTQDMTIEDLKLVLAILGGIVTIAETYKLLVNSFVYLQTVRARVWRFLADVITVHSFRRRAVATRIEEVLNQSAFKLRHHLPKGWIKRASIRWVRISELAMLHEGQIVLRIRPGINHEQSLMQSLYNYFCNALFPETKDILPTDIVSAIALAVTRASLEGEHAYLLEEFDERFIKSLSENQQGILDYYADFVSLNNYGYLMGALIREVDCAASDSRFVLSKAVLNEEIKKITAHMIAFQTKIQIQIQQLPEDSWSYNSNQGTSYGFLLISRPPQTRPAIDAYVKHAQSMVQRGIRRLYVIGRQEEKDFVNTVILAMVNIRELKVVSIFPLFRDYRGKYNGVGAMLAVNEILRGLTLTQRPLEVAQRELPLTAPVSAPESVSKLDVATENSDYNLAEIAENIIVQLSNAPKEWIPLTQFGDQLRKQIPDFTPKQYGGRNLMAVLEKMSTLELEKRGDGPAKAVYVRVKGGV